MTSILRCLVLGIGSGRATTSHLWYQHLEVIPRWSVQEIASITRSRSKYSTLLQENTQLLCAGITCLRV